MTSLYVYCLGDDLPEAAFEGLTGVCVARVRLLGLGRLKAVVSEVAEEPVALTEENLLAHNRVNAAALAHTTPLPFRFGTRTTAERLAEYASSNEAALAGALASVRGCVEMGVKLIERAAGARKAEDEGQAGEHWVRDSRDPAPPSDGVAATRVGRGTAFLLEKRREMLGEEASRLRAEELAGRLAAAVSGLARESAVRLNPSAAIAVRAAHLVERARVREYRERLRSLAAERTGTRLLTSGPWPPYSFSDISGQRRER